MSPVVQCVHMYARGTPFLSLCLLLWVCELPGLIWDCFDIRQTTAASSVESSWNKILIFHIICFSLSIHSAQIALVDPDINPGTFVNMWFRQTATAPVYLHPVNGTYWHIWQTLCWTQWGGGLIKFSVMATDLMRNESGNIIDYTHELINNKSKTITAVRWPVHVRYLLHVTMWCVFPHFHHPPGACFISPTIDGRQKGCMRHHQL